MVPASHTVTPVRDVSDASEIATSETAASETATSETATSETAASATAASETAASSITSIGSQQRLRRNDMSGAEAALMSGRAGSTLDSKFNRDVFYKLCEKFDLPTSGNKKTLIDRLITYVCRRGLSSTLEE